MTTKEQALEALDFIERLTNLLRSHINQDKWKPIETAPKDGTKFYARGYFLTPFKWKPYSPKSQQYKRGKRGVGKKWMNMEGGEIQNISQIVGVFMKNINQPHQKARNDVRWN